MRESNFSCQRLAGWNKSDSAHRKTKLNDIKLPKLNCF